MSLSEVFALAEKRLALGWTRGALARVITGECPRSGDPDAVCWCVLGSLGADTYTYDAVISASLLATLPRVAAREMSLSPAYFNDHKCPSQAAALRWVRRARRKLGV